MSKKKKRWEFIRPYLGKYKTRLIYGFTLVFLSTALYQIPPWMVKILIDKMENGFRFGMVIMPVSVMFGAILAESVTLFYQRLWIIRISRQIEYEMRNSLFLALQEQPKKFFDNNAIGKIMSSLTNDLDRLRDYLGPALLHLTRMLSMAIFTLICVWLLHWKLALLGIVPMFLLPVAVNRILVKMHKLYADIQKNLGELNSFVQDAVSGIQVIKAYGKEEIFQTKFEENSDRLRDNSFKVSLFTSTLWPTIGLMSSLGLLLVIWYGSVMVIREEITIGVLTAVLIYLLKIQFPIAGLGWVADLFQRSNAAVDRLLVLIDKFGLDSIHSLAAPKEKKFKKTAAGLIELKDLIFSYDGKTPILKNINLEIPAGSSLGIVGPTGSGKTTLLNVICGIYSPTQGGLFLNEKPRESYSTDEWQSNFSISPQDGFLFSKSIGENILFGKNKDSKLSLEEAGKISGFYRDLPQIQYGYDAMLGERGINLSGGQRQRVGLARALIANSPVLCLDDTLSALDTETEVHVQKNIHEAVEGKTAIIVSHRYSSVLNCDRIIVLEHGEIIEQGSHSELIALNGSYARVYNKQVIISSLEQE